MNQPPPWGAGQGYGPPPQGYGPPPGWQGPPQGYAPPPPKKTTPPPWLIVAACVFGSCVCVGALSGGKKDTYSTSGAAPEAPRGAGDTRPAKAAEPAEPAKPLLPPEPPPPAAELAGDVPKLEAELDANRFYTGIWKPTRRADLTLLLTGLSQVIAFSLIMDPVLTALKTKPGAEEAIVKIFMIHSRTNRFPTGFEASLRGHIDLVKGDAHSGLWAPHKKGQTPHDFTVLAMLLERENPSYVREMLAARHEGPTEWPEELDPKNQTRRYLSYEDEAIQWLGKLAPLSQAERDRIQEVRVERTILRPSLGTLLSEYKDNEVRADGKFKDKVVQVTGFVDDVKKDILDQIYVTVGTGQMFEIPVVQCFVAKGQEQKAANLSKGDKITVRGRVSGLLMNVLVKNCEIR